MNDSFRRNTLLATMSDDERRRLSGVADLVRVRTEELVSTPTRPSNYVVFPLDAVLSATTSTGTERIEVGLIGSEGVAGLDALAQTRSQVISVIAQIPGDVLRFPVSEFARAIQPHHAFASNLTRYAYAFLESAGLNAACNALHEVEKRLCRWILLANDRAGRDTFALTHETVGIMLGARRPSISLAMGRLRDDGLIDYGRGSVSVTNRSGLEARACSCCAKMRNLFTPPESKTSAPIPVT